MKPFSLSSAAKAEITRVIKASGCREPVITLSDSASLDLPDGLQSAVAKGMSDAEFQKVKRLAEDGVLGSHSSGSISVSVFEKAECRPEDLSEIDGLILAMTVPMREALRDYCLTYTSGRFMLEGPDEVVASLRSVKTLAKWFS